MWLLIVAAESMSGTIRQLWVVPLIGERLAHQFGVLVGAALILFVSWLTVRWLGASTARTQIQIGLLWVVLMVIFEFSLGAALGYTRERMFADYDLTQGGLMGLGLVFLLFAPWLGARLGNLGSTASRR